MLFRSLSVAIAGGALVHSAVASTCSKAKNFIYVVPDGYGVASQTFARDFYSITNGQGTVARPDTAALGVDSILIGTVKTQASDDLVTDSAASGTAFACGIPTYNGAIAVTDDGEPVASVLEAAHLDGFKTGLVVTSRITHATPAVYAAHVLDRDSENEIAGQQVGYSHPWGSVIDILIGGGRQHYLPSSEGGSRGDNVNLVNWAVEKGFTYAADKSDFLDVQENGVLPLPFLGLFANSHMDYEIDRNIEEQPSLLETTKASIDTLVRATSDSEKGYFIMIEASRIDHAGHSNDITSHLHETLMYNEVMLYLKEFVEAHPDTQLLSAADHECGGLTTPAGYDPTVLARGQHSGEYLEKIIGSFQGDDFAGLLRDTILPGIGIENYTDSDIQSWSSLSASSVSDATTSLLKYLAAEAGVNWSTGGHTSADIMLYGHASGDGCLNYMRDNIGGFRDNTELPGYVAKVLGLSLEDATKKLRSNGTSFVQRRHLLADIKARANAIALAHSHN